MTRKIIFTLLFMITAAAVSSDEVKKSLTMDEFLGRAVKNDPAFQVILIDNLYRKYNRALEMPPSDIVLGVTGQYNLLIYEKLTADSVSYTGGSVDNYVLNRYRATRKSDDRSSYEGSIALSKLFPLTGTSVTGAYSIERRFIQGDYQVNSAFSAEVSQPIARNAFGKSTRLLDKKVSVENRLARFQVIEACEDYLASLMTLYLDWYSTRENYRTAEEILKENRSLLATVQNKRRYRIALPEDVDKVSLEVMSAREDLVSLEDLLARYHTRIIETAALENGVLYEPVDPQISGMDESGTESIEKIMATSRTAVMLRLLERSGVLAEDIAREGLLPSLDLFLGYSLRGRDYTMDNAKHTIYGGITSAIGFIRGQEKARYGTARVDLAKIRASNRNSLLTLKIDLVSLRSEVEREMKLAGLSEEKAKVAEQILNAERRNYAIGRISLNDLIIARNNATRFRYEAVMRHVLYKQLLLEWKRLTDTLVVRGEEVKLVPE